jgi:hypothetical protein
MSKSKQIVDNLKSHTEKSQKLQAPAQSITIINGPLLIVGQGPFPQIIKGLTDLVETGTQHISQMQGMDPIAAGTESDNIFDAFREVNLTTLIDLEDVANMSQVRASSWAIS